MQSPPPPPPRDYNTFKDCISRNQLIQVNHNTFKNWRQQRGQGPQVINLNMFRLRFFCFHRTLFSKRGHWMDNRGGEAGRREY